MQKTERVNISVKTGLMAACGISDRGLERPENEDAIYVDTNGKFVLLADGMGGHERGAEASRMAVDIIQKYFDPDVLAAELQDITDGGGMPPEISSLLSLVDSAVVQANKDIYERNQQAGLQRFMGTTVVGLVLIEGGYALWFHVGDSRLYRWRDGTLQCLTTDHSAYMEWVRKGKQGAAPKSNVITRAIGPNPAVSESTGWDTVETGDIYFLCSDGLNDMISEYQITEILKQGGDVDGLAARLIDAALKAGGKDNVSTIVCQV